MAKKMGVGLEEFLIANGVNTVQWKTGDPSGEIDPATGRVKVIVVSGPFRPEFQAFEPRRFRADAGIVLPDRSKRYGDSPPGAEFVGRGAERRTNNYQSLKDAFAAGKLGSPDEYDGDPTDQDVNDAEATGAVEIGLLSPFALDRLTGDVGTLSRPLHIDETGPDFGATRKVALTRDVRIRVEHSAQALGAGQVVYVFNVHGGQGETVDLKAGDYTELVAASTVATPPPLQPTPQPAPVPAPAPTPAPPTPTPSAPPTEPAPAATRGGHHGKHRRQ